MRLQTGLYLPTHTLLCNIRSSIIQRLFEKRSLLLIIISHIQYFHINHLQLVMLDLYCKHITSETD